MRKRAGIVDNDWIEAYNLNGALTARAVVSQRVPEGMVLMYHAQEKIVNTPGSEIMGTRGGIHNSVTRTCPKPTHMIGGYAQQSYGFNYYGTIGTNRDEFVIVRKMAKVDWMDGEQSATQPLLALSGIRSLSPIHRSQEAEHDELSCSLSAGGGMDGARRPRTRRSRRAARAPVHSVGAQRSEPESAAARALRSPCRAAARCARRPSLFETLVRMHAASLKPAEPRPAIVRRALAASATRSARPCAAAQAGRAQEHRSRRRGRRLMSSVRPNPGTGDASGGDPPARPPCGARDAARGTGGL